MPETLRAASLGRERLRLSEIFSHGTRLLQLPAESARLRIAVSGSATTDLIARAIAIGCVQEGVPARLYQSPFGAWRQDAIDPGSALHRSEPDIVVLATDWRDGVTGLALDASAQAVADSVAGKVASYRAIWTAIARRGETRIIHHLPVAPPGRLAGIAEQRLPASPRRQIEALRVALLEAGPEIVFLDPEPLGWDARSWFGAKLQFPQERLPDYVVLFRAALRAATGRAKKVLALDLDNTLWGGVIGDDGIDGLKLGPENPAGDAFAAFQSHAKALAARGIILAVCSKNDRTTAEAGFLHPHSVLSRADFAAFECSWADKAGGLRRIAQTLNVGLDAIVFADDNPAECALVRRELPEIAVVELGTDPSSFIGRLEEGSWFDLQSLGAADFTRGAAYQARAEAQAEMSGTTDLEGFLSGLDMRGRVFRADGAALARIAQLEGKTNQFNLTTRRYDEAAVRAFAERPDALVLGATLVDKFGDHGLVSSVIATGQDNALVIESWLMSCRVFSRSLEQFVMRALIAEARARGLSLVVGAYAPSPKNSVVADLFTRLGFHEIEPGRLWRRETAGATSDLITLVANQAGG